MEHAPLHPTLADAPSEAIRELLDLVAAAMFIVDIDPDGTFRFGGLNRTHEDLTGMRSADVIGRKPEECLPSDVAAAVTERYRQCIAADAAIDYRECIEHPAGLRWWRTTLMPMRDPASGRIIRLVGSALDITTEVAAQQQMEEQARLYQETFDRTPVMKLTLGPDRLIKRVSDYMLRRLGYGRDEMLGHLSGEFMTEESAARGRNQVVPQTLRDGAVHDVPYTLLTKAGAEVDVLISVIAIRDGAGEVIEFNLVALEITELNRANMALAATVARLDDAQRLNQEIYDSTPAMLYTVAPDRTIVRVSDHWLKVMGYDREAVIGRTSMDFMDLPSARYAREEVIPRFRREGQITNIPYTFLKADGTPMEVLLSSTMVYDDDGRERRANTVMVDVTERNRAFRDLDRAHREIVAQEELERERYDRTPAMLYTLGPDFRIIGVSDYWLKATGYRRDQVIGRLPFDFMTERAMVRAREEVIPTMLERDRVDEIPLELFRADGSVMEVLLSSVGERGEEGGFERIFSVMRDVTERNRAHRDLEAAYRELEEKNQELEHFAHIASHDLREPLRKVRAFADRLRRKAAADLGAENLIYLERIESAVDRMRDLIQDLMALSVAGSREVLFDHVDMSTLVHHVAADLDHAIQAVGGTVTIEGDFCAVAGDASQLEQLFANLVGNALKYRAADRPVEVRIAARQDDRNLYLSVSDNGIGFESDYAERIFKPFVRLHGHGAFEGTGMGLAICQKIVSRHNGSISADGRPGEGARFRITLPRERPAAIGLRGPGA
ncbi:PAS domain S-box protein [Marinibaculum pumilum]|uniref:histidine kinase n=1 Tax=Marinibaculum pumilum TaxID=1766165 RepID=A0ABV7L415_9PROT